MTHKEAIIVVGAGWAGLTAAFTVAKAGHRVILLEAAPQAGGRARGIAFGEDIVDNGQHLFIGAYQETLNLLKDLHIREASVFKRTPLELFSLNLKEPLKPFHLKLSQLPFPVQFLGGFLSAKGLSFSEKLKAIQFARAITQPHFGTQKDISVQQLFINFEQPQSLITKLWEPIALAALSTPIEIASAEVFIKVLTETFAQNNKNSNWLFPKTNLSDVIPAPILDYLQKKHSPVLYHQRVNGLIIEKQQCKGVFTETREYRGKAVILATPPHVSAQLLKSDPTSEKLCHSTILNLQKFQYQPITTVYLRYPKAVFLEFNREMVGLINSTGHWLFHRHSVGQSDLYSVVITGLGPHSNLNHQALIKQLHHEIAQLIPSLNHPLIDSRVICEKRAAFSCEIGSNAYRPLNYTPLENLWLCGDYTRTHYPATLEGAIQSGRKAAQLILLNKAILVKQ